ncbi:MAG: glutaminase [Burkholderiaceae bacterium]
MPQNQTDGSMISDLLQSIHARYSSLHDGNVATYIPALAQANPDRFGVCVVSTRGDIFEVGDSRTEFTIQSCSKALVYAHALSTHGRTKVLERVGIEPSGDAFNSIALDASNRAFNPMVNAGAITTAGFIEGADFAERRATLLRCFSAAAGRELEVDETVYASERETGHRNRALAWLVTNFDRMDPATNMDDAGPVLPAVLGARECARSCGDGSDAGEPRRQSADQGNRVRHGEHAGRAVGDGHLRHVRLRRRVGVTASACRPRAVSVAASSAVVQPAARHRNLLARGSTPAATACAASAPSATSRTTWACMPSTS